MEEHIDLRSILAHNIRAARKSLHLTQAKLAEYAEISLPYISDIEYCKTWVSDKTLLNIARVLNMEAYELLRPPEGKLDADVDKKRQTLQKISEIISTKKGTMKRATDEALDDLILQIIKLYS